MTSLGPISTGLLQNATFLQNVFITTFLATLGLETVRNILGELDLSRPMLRDSSRADCNDKYSRARYQIQPSK